MQNNVFIDSFKTLAPTPCLFSEWVTALETKALADLKGKGMQINGLSPSEVNRMREKLGAINATIAANVGEALWRDVQNAVAQALRLPPCAASSPRLPAPVAHLGQVFAVFGNVQFVALDACPVAGRGAPHFAG